VIARRGGLVTFAQTRDERLDPVGPTPARCFALGRAVAGAFAGTDLRVALVASSSWSHAFLVDKNWRLRPDTASDLWLYEMLTAGDYENWQARASKDILESGQQELLNWFCMTGAAAELGLELTWSDLVVTDVFNSNKCFAIFQEAGQR